MILSIFLVFLYLNNFINAEETEKFDNATTPLPPLSDSVNYADNRMKAIGEYFSDLMGCGDEGWCAFRCCPTSTTRRFYPNPNYNTQQYGRILENTRKTPYMNRNPVMRTTTTTLSPAKHCAKACMPQCTTRCLQRYNQIVSSFMNSLTAIDVMGQPVSDNARNIRFSPRKRIECRDECMPYCTPQCIEAYSHAAKRAEPKVCKPVCMPECTDECITSPPLMVPCVYDNVCHCPAGYVKCSEMTCCMKYKTMAVRYNNRMTSMSYNENDETLETTTSNNSTVSATTDENETTTTSISSDEESEEESK
ncbi:unnamed protein product [Caenorhabditis angaria]|uniref:Uncharacterized protein n=1 Tax=Caenorhabditis angaria TaxID=860376 RepID=A0A9P1N8V4_9PELO|nr:unnamed protein product [Caenorhabditis angaria]